MSMRAKNLKFYLSVEGQTEAWYFEWLQKQINAQLAGTARVSFTIRVGVTPESMLKKVVFWGKARFIHILDVESSEYKHIKKFESHLKMMTDLMKKDKNIQYSLGYCNFSFELWMILHKSQCMSQLTDRKQYLWSINGLYHQKFESLKEYKEEQNFKKILTQLTLDDVIEAVKRADRITENNKKYSKPQSFGRYEYFKDNPSLSVHEFIKEIFKQYKLM